jgi:hypothetical protein
VNRLAAVGRFWWDFIVGDDWRVAAVLAVALALSAVLAHGGVAAWWVVPAGMVVALAVGLRRATRR